MKFKEYYQLDEGLLLEVYWMIPAAATGVYELLAAAGIVTLVATDAATGGQVVVKPTQELINNLNLQGIAPKKLNLQNTVALAAALAKKKPSAVANMSTSEIVSAATKLANHTPVRDLTRQSPFLPLDDISSLPTPAGVSGSAVAKPTFTQDKTQTTTDAAAVAPQQSKQSSKTKDSSGLGAEGDIPLPLPKFPWWILLAIGGTAYAIKKYRNYKKKKREEDEKEARKDLEITIKKDASPELYAKYEDHIIRYKPYKAEPIQHEGYLKSALLGGLVGGSTGAAMGGAASPALTKKGLLAAKDKLGKVNVNMPIVGKKKLPAWAKSGIIDMIDKEMDPSKVRQFAATAGGLAGVFPGVVSGVLMHHLNKKKREEEEEE